jgi:glycosyltransferase involved in cell wall biosynthesis
MRRPTILLVSYHYLPAATPGSHRLNTVARLLTARGWDCVILTATGADAGPNSDGGIEVIRTTRRHLRSNHGRAAIDRPVLSRIPGVRRAVGFPDKYAPWGAALVPRLLQLLGSRSIDVVLSSSPPHSTHAAIAAARSFRTFRWAAEFRDPWMFPSRRPPGALSARIQRGMERHVLRRADVVIANTPGNRDALLAANPDLDAARIRVSTNGYDASLFADGTLPATPRETADLTYVGELYDGMLERFGAALASIRARNPGHVPRIAVYGTINAPERRRIAALGLEDCIEDRGFVPHEESIAAMKNARALLVLLPPQERWRTCVPSKLYWYLAARRPIVAVVPDGDAAGLVRRLGAGHALVDDDADAVGRALEAIVVNARSSPPARIDTPGAGKYSMDAIVDDLDAMLREVIRGNPA